MERELNGVVVCIDGLGEKGGRGKWGGEIIKILTDTRRLYLLG